MLQGSVCVYLLHRLVISKLYCIKLNARASNGCTEKPVQRERIWSVSRIERLGSSLGRKKKRKRRTRRRCMLLLCLCIGPFSGPFSWDLSQPLRLQVMVQTDHCESPCPVRV